MKKKARRKSHAQIRRALKRWAEAKRRLSELLPPPPSTVRGEVRIPKPPKLPKILQIQDRDVTWESISQTGVPTVRPGKRS